MSFLVGPERLLSSGKILVVDLDEGFCHCRLLPLQYIPEALNWIYLRAPTRTPDQMPGIRLALVAL